MRLTQIISYPTLTKARGGALALHQRRRHPNRALTEAQEFGYAETDPTYDIEGYDTAHKIAILASLAFGMAVTSSRAAAPVPRLSASLKYSPACRDSAAASEA